MFNINLVYFWLENRAFCMYEYRILYLNELAIVARPLNYRKEIEKTVNIIFLGQTVKQIEWR